MFSGVLMRTGGRKRKTDMEREDSKKSCEISEEIANEIDFEFDRAMKDIDLSEPVAGCSGVMDTVTIDDSGDEKKGDEKKGDDFGADQEGDAEMYSLVCDLSTRQIEKADVLEVGEVYQLADIYIMNIKNSRLAPVGGMRKEGSQDLVYIWLPSKLFLNTKNDDELSSVIEKLKCGIEKKKFAYIMSKGKGISRNGFPFYDIIWYKYKK